MTKNLNYWLFFFLCDEHHQPTENERHYSTVPLLRFAWAKNSLLHPGLQILRPGEYHHHQQQQQPEPRVTQWVQVGHWFHFIEPTPGQLGQQYVRCVFHLYCHHQLRFGRHLQGVQVTRANKRHLNLDYG